MGIGILLKFTNKENPNSPPLIIIDKDKITIGRQADVYMDTSNCKEISKHHSTIFRKIHKFEEVWMIEDNNSLNGTFVNGRKIRRLTIQHGDEIVFGGGSSFNLGDKVLSTELAECRYIFYLPPPPIKFCSEVDLNQSLVSSDLVEMCSICYLPAFHRETLPCGHTFCLNCIHEWSKVCTNSMQPSVCPMCRRIFSKTDLTPDEAIINSSEIKVFTIEPFLRDLKVKSCKVIKSVSIFKNWKQNQKEWFWNSFELVNSNTIRLYLFLHLTKASLPYILRATKSELENAIKNFNEEPEIDKNKLLIQLLKILFTKLIQRNKPSNEIKRIKIIS